MNARLVAWSTLVLLFGAIAFATYLTGAGNTGTTPEFFTWTFAVGGLVQYAVILGIVLAIAIRLPFRETFAWRRPESVARAVGIAVGAVVLVAVVSAVVTPLLHPGKAQGIVPQHWVHGREGPFALSLVDVSVAAPLVEELMFRGLGFRLLERFGRRFAIVAVGVAFGVWHGIPETLPILIPFGAALAYLRERTHSVIPGMVVHALFNAAAIVLAVV